MKMRLQVQGAQETTPRDSVEFSDNDIEVACGFSNSLHTLTYERSGDKPLHQWVGVCNKVCQDYRPFFNTKVSSIWRYFT